MASRALLSFIWERRALQALFRLPLRAALIVGCWVDARVITGGMATRVARLNATTNRTDEIALTSHGANCALMISAIVRVYNYNCNYICYIKRSSWLQSTFEGHP